MKMKKANQAALLILFAFWFIPAIANAQQYEPSVGQEGKDVIWVPTPEELIQAMLDAAKVTSDDYVMDLGSGDGRIVIAAAKRGAQAVGIEYNPDMVELSIRNAEKAGVSQKASFRKADIFESDFSKATVVTMYLLPHLNLKLRPTILNLKPGTRIVSHAFNMGDWSPDQTIEKEYRTAYLWIVPAKVEGVWKWRSGSGAVELMLTQNFQKITGTLKADGKDIEIKNAKLEGTHISFSDGVQEYSGRVNGNSIEGTIKANGRDQTWSAALQ
jgi:SAM-dependent methyltransferase